MKFHDNKATEMIHSLLPDGMVLIIITLILSARHFALFLRSVRNSGFAKMPLFLTENQSLLVFRSEGILVIGCVAQLNRASDYGSEGYRFESDRGYPIPVRGSSN